MGPMKDPNLTTLRYKFFNPNPRGARVNDCVKRAIVVVTDKDYHEVEVEMNRLKVRKNEPYNYHHNYINYIERHLKLAWLNVNPDYGKPRWHVSTVGEALEGFEHLRFILRVSKHLIGVKNHTILDTFDGRLRDKAIYKIWVSGANEKELSILQKRLKGGGNRFVINQFNKY